MPPDLQRSGRGLWLLTGPKAIYKGEASEKKRPGEFTGLAAPQLGAKAGSFNQQ
jgi:hypothetical protein